MKIDIEPAKYVLAVSGGVDSMVLLDILAKTSDVKVIIAHFNHGIREDASKDEQLVIEVANKYGLEIEVGHDNLGVNASEEKARVGRYKFLESVKEKHQAKSIMTAHHQDDLIETALLNLMRGSGRRGLSAIADSKIKRPLLNIPKSQIIKYAKENKIIWREDITNNDTNLLRNYLRQKILPAMNSEDRQKIISNLDKVAKVNKELNKQIATLSHNLISNNSINRQQFTQLPQEVAIETIMYWLRERHFRDFDSKTINRLTMAIKTALPNTRQIVKPNLWLVIEQKSAHFTTTD